MDKHFSWVFLLASGAFFLFVVGLTGYRIENARRVNTFVARQHVTELSSKIRSVRDSTGGYGAPQFKIDMRAVFDAEPRLLLLSLYSADDGMLYLAARSRSIMTQPASITPEWRGTPVYQVSRGYEVLLSRNVEEGTAGPTMDALFVVMGREDLYPVVRDDLYLFLAFLLVCGVLILIVMSVQYDSPPRRASVTDAAPPAPPAAPEAPAVLRAAAPGAAAPLAPPAMAPAPTVAPPRAVSAPLDSPRPPLVSPRPAGAALGTRPDANAPSARTGLVRGELLEPRLRRELEHAASAHEDVSLARIRIDKPFADAKLPVEHASIARLLREGFRPEDLIFETGTDSCTLIMPGVDVEAAVSALEGFRTKVSRTAREPRAPTVSIGVSSRGRRLVDSETLLEEAEVSMTKAWREGGDQVIGFRADPALFREAVSAERH